MADALSKITLFYGSSNASAEQPGAGATPPTGWTETFYSGSDDLAGQILVARTYLNARIPLFGVGAFAQSIRVAAFPLVRKTTVSFILGKQGVANLFTSIDGDDYDPTMVDLLLRVEGLNNSRRQLWIAGLPDSQTSTLKQQGMNAAFLASPAFNQYVNALLATQWGIRQHDRGSGKPGTFSFRTFNKVTPIMVRRRDRGRPFYLFRGRRTA